MIKKHLLVLLAVFGLLALMVVPALAVNWVTVVVQPGETLAKIAQRHCTTWQAIFNANQAAIGPNPNIVAAGTVLIVPANCLPGSSGGFDRGPSTHARGTINNGIYTVVWGDTLFSIAHRFGVPVNALRAANGMPANQTRINAGTQLIIPGHGNNPSPLPSGNN